MVVGNKKDLEENRMIEMMDAAKFAQENGISRNLTLPYRLFVYGDFCYDWRKC